MIYLFDLQHVTTFLSTILSPITGLDKVIDNRLGIKGKVLFTLQLLSPIIESHTQLLNIISCQGLVSG